MFLLESITAEQVKNHLQSNVVASDSVRDEFQAIVDENNASILSLTNSTGVIPVSGVLTPSPELWMIIFNYEFTTYSDIRLALEEADANPDIDEIVLAIDSPGGSVFGLFELLDFISSVSTPVCAKVSNMACSAAYAIACKCATISIDNRSGMVGSIGVVDTYYIDDEKIDVTSTDAPNKRVDVRTEEGLAVARGKVDPLHKLFAEVVAAGRNTTVENVNMNFGRGGVVFADEALALGMIDSIGVYDRKDDKRILTIEAINMDIKALQLEHPALYEEAVAAGVDKEHKRVSAHLEMAKSGGESGFAIAKKMIESGSDLSIDVVAKYHTAALSNRDIVSADKADEQVASAVDGATVDARCETSNHDAFETALRMHEERAGISPGDK